MNGPLIRRRLAVEDGVTLTEMLVVLAILVVVITSLTTLFVSASTSQIDQTSRVKAQQEARLALDALRREIHCAKSVTGTPPTSSISLTLGQYCQNGGTKLTGTLPLTIPAGGLPNVNVTVADTSPFLTPNADGTWRIYIGTNAGEISCTGKTANSFTGCTSGLASTQPVGTVVAGISTITWCTKDANGASPPAAATPPYSLWRYRGASCSGNGRKHADFLAEGTGVSAGQVFNGYPVVPAGNRRLLQVVLPVDSTPADTKQRFTLRDDIVLRNSPRS